MATTTKRGASTKASKSAKSATTSKKPSAKKTSKKPTTKSKVTNTATAKSSVKVAPVKPKAKAPKSDADRLRVWNFVIAFVLAAQAVALLAVFKTYLLPVTTSFQTADSLASTEATLVQVLATRHLFDVNIAYLLVGFLFIGAFFRLYSATLGRKNYQLGVDNGVNRLRWFEYSVTFGLMMIVMSMLVGVSDLTTLLLVFGGTLGMLFLASIKEATHKPRKLLNATSALIGIGVWLPIIMYVLGSNKYGTDGIPGYVYVVVASLLAIFILFDLNMYLHNKKRGRWASYVFTEKSYMFLSLVAYSALTWQVFAGALR
jgi:hypothetical protein